jgi:hypothetical protein
VGGVRVEDDQYDISARLGRVNGLVPFVGFVVTSSLFLVTEITLFLQKRYATKSMDLEGCPPLPMVIKQGRLTGMESYKITANPDYKHLFDTDGNDEVAQALM